MTDTSRAGMLLAVPTQSTANPVPSRTTISMRVPTTGTITGRNGTAELSAVHIWEGVDRVYFDGVSRHGVVINGGFGFPLATMDQVAVAWLRSRGWTVTPPAAEDAA